MNVRFSCPACDAPAGADLPAGAAWQCSACDHRQPLSASADGTLTACAVCGNHELYKRKDFPHALGMTILVVACAASVLTHWLYHWYLTWVILIGTALFDGLLYLWVGDVVVCYRCNAHHRGYVPNLEHQGHELTVAERYRQERIRREQMEADKK